MQDTISISSALKWPRALNFPSCIYINMFYSEGYSKDNTTTEITEGEGSVQCETKKDGFDN